MKTHATVFTLGSGNQFFQNAGLTNFNPPYQGVNVPNPYGTNQIGTREFQEWTWEYEGLYPDTPKDKPVNQGLVFRFCPQKEMNVKQIQINAVSLPRLGMMTHLIGRVSIVLACTNTSTINGAPWPAFFVPGPTTNNQNIPLINLADTTNLTRITYTSCWDGYDCDSPLEVLNKYFSVINNWFKQGLPNLPNVVDFTTGTCGSIFMRLNHGFALSFDVHRYGQVNSLYSYYPTANTDLQQFYVQPDRAAEFFGNNTMLRCADTTADYFNVDPHAANESRVYWSFTTAGSNTLINTPRGCFHSLGRFTFPFAQNIKLNCRTISSALCERNFNENMQVRKSSVIAIFPLSADKNKSGYGAGINRNYYAKNPSRDPTNLYYDSTSRISEIQLWFTYGSDNKPLYLPVHYYSYNPAVLPMFQPNATDVFTHQNHDYANVTSIQTICTSVNSQLNNRSESGSRYAYIQAPGVTPTGNWNSLMDNHGIIGPIAHHITNNSDPSRGHYFQNIFEPLIGVEATPSIPTYAKGKSFMDVFSSLELTVFTTFHYCSCDDKETEYIDNNTYMQQ